MGKVKSEHLKDLTITAPTPNKAEQGKDGF
jgi:hypothetical protein